MKVRNRKVIRHLSWKSMGANRTRNIVAILAIALTALLFTSLFTIAMSINEGFQQSNFRQVGGYSHGGFKYLTEDEMNDLKDDPLIDEYGERMVLGVPVEAPFNKTQVELSYCDANAAKWYYAEPTTGTLPQEGTNEAAADTRVLDLLGVKPELGTTFTMTFNVAGRETTQTFTLCGYWEGDAAAPAHHVLLPQSRVEAIIDELGVTPGADDSYTGLWNLDVMLESGSRHIEADLNQILADHGYQSEDVTADNYINIGINWGYTGAQFADSFGVGTIAAIAAILLLILFTGYLIIYNVFQISVAGDVRFYGLLKTIGTTPRQIRRMIRQQALLLSIVGIPIGLVLGWFMGRILMPVIVSQLDGIELMTSTSPWIFVGSALFALVTVFISCLRPGRMAGRVSPIEALRYTEASGRTKGSRKKEKVSLFSMAWANLGRSRGKTIVTILSLALAVVLLTVTVTFTSGFDMDKYLRYNISTDFEIGTVGFMQGISDSVGFNVDEGLPESVIADVEAQGGITDGGRSYGTVSSIQEFVTEDWLRSSNSRWYDEEALDQMVADAERNTEGLYASEAQLYGMDDYCLDHLNVIEGDLSDVYESGSRAIAAVVSEDDYGNTDPASHWAKIGDTVTLRYVEEWEYLDTETGETLAPEDLPDNLGEAGRARYQSRAKTYHEETYTVVALVTVPNSLDYDYGGNDEFVLNADTFQADSGTSSIMYYAFDTEDAATDEMEAFLADYTENVNPDLDYISKLTYVSEFEGFRNMFAMTGGALSFIVALVGVLNFFNAILTGITSRRRELAMLQSIGMTGSQLRKMLALEGLLYTLGALALSTLLTLAMALVLPQAIESMFWFFSYHLTLWPILVLLPVFILIGAGLPLISERIMRRQSIVDRLRQE